MSMTLSLIKNITEEVKKLKEQAPPPPPPPPDPAAGAPAETPGAPPPDAPPDAGADAGGDEAESSMPEGQPPVDSTDPSKSVVDYAKELAGKTTDVERILTGVKTSIQYNFGGDFGKAAGIVQRLRDEEKVVLDDVANRLQLFINGTIVNNPKPQAQAQPIQPVQPNQAPAPAPQPAQTPQTLFREGKNVMTKNQLKQLIREAVKTSQKRISLEEKIQKEVLKKLYEGGLFDTYRSQVGQVRTGIEQQLLSTEIQDMAIDLFEKICQKVGLDSDNLTPDAEKFIKAELDQMVVSAQDLGVKLAQVAAVVKSATGGTAKSSSEEGQG